jgi:hypothetical protein
MTASLNLKRLILSTLTAAVLSCCALAADPGLVYPATSEVSDQKAGSILVYNLYASSTVSPDTDSRISTTNTSVNFAAFVHVFLIQGSDCSVADRFTCFTAQQTSYFLASDLDPGITGYIVMVAVDGVLGCPVSHNFLMGDVFVKLSNGLHGNLGAEAIAAESDPPALGCDETTTTIQLVFGGGFYNRVPRVLAVDNFPAINDGYTSVVVVNRIGGNLQTGAGTIGTIFGVLFNDAEAGLSFTLRGGCQRVFGITDSDVRTTPRPSVHVPANSSGWMKFWSTDNIGIMGAVITGHPAQASARNAFTGARNLHKLRLAVDAFVMPVFPPTC